MKKSAMARVVIVMKKLKSEKKKTKTPGYKYLQRILGIFWEIFTH